MGFTPRSVPFSFIRGWGTERLFLNMAEIYPTALPVVGGRNLQEDGIYLKKHDFGRYCLRKALLIFRNAVLL
jgi:hypothetical protein